MLYFQEIYECILNVFGFYVPLHIHDFEETFSQYNTISDIMICDHVFVLGIQNLLSFLTNFEVVMEINGILRLVCEAVGLINQN
jgi:hypothetical protein